MLLEVLISGIVTGSIYTLLALAINLIYSTTGIINFAHGELVMLGGMFGLVLVVQAGLPFIVGLVAVCALVALDGPDRLSDHHSARSAKASPPRSAG